MKRLSSILAVALLAASSAFANVTITLSDTAAAELRAALGTPAVPPVVAPPVVVASPTVSINAVKDDDIRYLVQQGYQYRVDLVKLPGSKQLFEDMLTGSDGKTVTGGTRDTSLQARINVMKNRGSAGGDLYIPGWTAAQYTGPLTANYKALVASKLGK